MASLSYSLSLFLPLLFSTLTFHPFSPTIFVNADQISLINEICSAAFPENFNFCSNVLFYDPRSYYATTIDKMCLLSITITIESTNATSTKISRLLEQETDSISKTRLHGCKENYEKALSDLKKAYKLSEAKAYKDLMTFAKAAASEGKACENSYSKKPIRANPIAEDNKGLDSYAKVIICAATRLPQ